MAESETERGSKDVTQTQQRPESPTVTLTWHASQAKVHKLHQSPTVTLTWHASQAKRYMKSNRVTAYTFRAPLVDLMYCVFTGIYRLCVTRFER